MLSWIVAILFLSLPLTSQFQKRKEDLQDKNKKMYLFQDVSGHNKIPRKASFPSLDDIDNRINENYSVINFKHKEKITEKHQDDSETGFSGVFIGEQKDYRYVINGTAVQSEYLNKPTSLENYFDRSNSLLSYRNTADDYDKIVFPLHYEGVSDKMAPVNRRIYASGSFENFGNKIDLKEKIKDLAGNKPRDRLASSKTNFTNLNKIYTHSNNKSLFEEKPILDLYDGINSSSRDSIVLNKKKSILRPENLNKKPILKTTNNKSYIIETDKEKTSEQRYTFKVPQRNNTAMNKNQEISTPSILENIVKISQKKNLAINERKPISNYINQSDIRINKRKHISSYKDSSDIFQELEEYDMVPNKELSVSSPTNISDILKASNTTGLKSNNDSIIQNMNDSNYLLTRYYPNSKHYNTTQPSTYDNFVDINKASGFHKDGGTILTNYSISEYSTNGLDQNTTPWSLNKHDINTVPLITLNNYFDIKNKSEASYQNNSNLTGRNDKNQANIPNNMVLSSNIRLLNLVGTNNTLHKSQYNIPDLIKQDIIYNKNKNRIVSIDFGKHGLDMKVPNKIKTPIKGLSDFRDKISNKERTSLFSNLWNLDKQMKIKTINETENSPNSLDKNNYLPVQLENLYVPQIIEKDVTQFREKMDIDKEKSGNLNKTMSNITFSLNDESKVFLELNKDLENVSSPIQSQKVKILSSHLSILNNSKVTTNKFSKQDTLNLVPLTLKNNATTTLAPNNFMVVSHSGNESNVATAAFGETLNKIFISGVFNKFKNISNVISKKVHHTTTPIALKYSKPIELNFEGNNINTLTITSKMKDNEKDNINGNYNITSDNFGSQTNIDLKQIFNLNQASNSGHETPNFTSATKMNFSLIKTPIINSSVVNILRNPTTERLIKLPGIYINNLNIFVMDSKENISESEIIKLSAIPKKYPQDIKNRNFLIYDKTNLTSVTPKGNHEESSFLGSRSTLQRKITFLIQFPEIIVSKLNETGPFEISSRNQSLYDKYEDDEMTMIKPPIMGSAPSYSLADSKSYSNTKTYENHKKNRIPKKMHLTFIEKEMDTPHKSLPRVKNEGHITNVLQLQLPLVVDSNSKQGYQIQLSDEIKVNDHDNFKPKNKKQHSSEILEKPPLTTQKNFEKMQSFNEKNNHSKPKKILLDTYPMAANSKMTPSTPRSFLPITMSYNSKIIKPRSRLRKVNIPMSYQSKYKIKLIQSDDLLNTRNHHRQKRNIANSLFQHLKNKLNWTDSQDFPKDYGSEKVSTKSNGQTTIEGKGTLPNDISSPFSNSESNKVIQNESITFSNNLEHVYPTPRDIWRKNRRSFSSNKREKNGEIYKNDQENEKLNSSETNNNSTFLVDRFSHNKDSYRNSNLSSVLNKANKNRLKVARNSFSPTKNNHMRDKAIADILHIEQITHDYKNRKNSDIKSFKVNVSPIKQLPTPNFISSHRTLAAYIESNISANLDISDRIVDNDFDFKGDNETEGTLSNDGLVDTAVNINYNNDKNNSSNDNIKNIQSPREQQSTNYINDSDSYTYYNSKNESYEVEDKYLTGSNLVSQENEFKRKIFYLTYLPVPIAYDKEQFLEFSNVSGKHSTYVEFQIIPLIGTLTLSKIKTLLHSNNLTNNYNSSAIRREVVKGRITSTNNYTVHPNKFKNKVNDVYFRERNTTLHSPKIFETVINANNTIIDSPYNMFHIGNRYIFDKLPNPEIIEVIEGYSNFHEVQKQNFTNLLVLNTHTNKNNSSLFSNDDIERPKSVQIHKYTGRRNVSEEHDPAKQGPKMFNSSFNAVKDENNVNIFKNHVAPNYSLSLDTKSRKNMIKNSKLSSNSRQVLNKKTNSNNNTNYWDRLFRNIQNTYSDIVNKIINITIQDDNYIKPSSNNNSNKLTNVTHVPSKDNDCKNQSLCDEKINITKPFYSVEYNSSLLPPFESTSNILFPNIWTDKTYANITNINNRFEKPKTARTLHSETTEIMLMSSISREMSNTLSSNVLIDLATEYNSFLNSKDITTTKNLKYKNNQFFENSSNEEDSHEASILSSSTTFSSRKFFGSLSTSQLSLTSQPFKFKHPIEQPSWNISANNNSLRQQINIDLFHHSKLGPQTFSTEVSIFQTKHDGLKSLLSTKTRKSSRRQNTGSSYLNGIKENLRSESLSFKQANSSNVTGNRELVKSIIYKEEPEKFTLSSNLLGSDYSQKSRDRANKNVLLNHSLKPVKTFFYTDKSSSEALTNQYHKSTNMFSEMYQIKQIQRNETSLTYSKFNNLFYPTEKYNANIFETRNVVNSSEQHLNIITKYDSRSESKSTNQLYGSSNNMFSFMNNMKNYQEYHYASSHHSETNAEKLHKQYVVLQTTEINSMLNMFESADKNTTSNSQVNVIDFHAEQNKIRTGAEMSSTFYNEDKLKGKLFNNSKQFIHFPHSYNPFVSVSPTAEITQILNSTINYWKNITSEQKVSATKIHEDSSFGDKHNMQSQDSKHDTKYGETKCMYEIETSRLPTSNQLEKYVNMDANKDESNKPYLQETNIENTSSSHLIKINDIVKKNYLDNSTTNSSKLSQFISDTDDIENKEIATPELNLNLNITFQTKNQITSNTSNGSLDDVKITLMDTDVPILNSTSNVDFNLNNTIIYTYDPEAIFNKTVNNLMKHNNESNNIFVDKYINYSDPDEIKTKKDISITNNHTSHYKINSTIMGKNYKAHNLINSLIPFNSSEQIIYLINNNNNKTGLNNKTSSIPKSFSNSEGSLSLTVPGLEYNTKPDKIFKANYTSLEQTSLNKGNFMISNPLSLMDMTNYTDHIYPSNIHRDKSERDNYTNTNYMASEVNQFTGYNKSIINLKTSYNNNDYYKTNHTSQPIINNNKYLNKNFIHLDSTTNENTTEEHLFEMSTDLLTGGGENIVQITSTPEDDNIFNNVIFLKFNKTQIQANNNNSNNNQTQTILFVNEANAKPNKNATENGNTYFGGISHNINKTKVNATLYNMDVAVVDATSVPTHDKYFNGTFNEITQLEMNNNDTRSAVYVNNLISSIRSSKNDNKHLDEMLSEINRTQLMKINNNTDTLLSSNEICASEINKNNLNNNNYFSLEPVNNITHSEMLIACVKDENNKPKSSSESKNILNSFISQQVNKTNEIINNNNTESVLSENKVILVPLFSANGFVKIHDKGTYFEINKTNPELNNNYSDPMISGMEENKLSQTHKPAFDFIYNNGIGYEINTTKIHINNNSSYSIFSEDDSHLFMNPVGKEINDSIDVTNILIKNNYNETVIPDFGINMVPSIFGIEPEITFNNAKSQEYNSTIVQKTKNYYNPFLPDSEINPVSLVSEPEDKHYTVIIQEVTATKEQISKNLNNSYVYDVDINLVPTISTLEIENIVYTGIPNQVNNQNVYINTDSNNPLLLVDKVTIKSSIFDLEPENINNYLLSQNFSIKNKQMNSSNTDAEDKLNISLLLSAPDLEFINNNVISSEVNNTTLPTTKNYNDSIYDAEINISLIPKDTKTQMNNTFNNVLINVTKIDSIPNMSTLVIDSLYIKDIINEFNKKDLPIIISYTEPLASSTQVNLVSSVNTLEHIHIKNIIPQNNNVSYVQINNSYTNSKLFEDEVNLIPTLSAPVLDIINNNNISYENNKTKVENTNIHTDPLISGAELNIVSLTFRPDHDIIHINGINSETNTVQIQLNNDSYVPIVNNYGKVNLAPAKSDINTEEIQTNIIFNEVDSKIVKVNNSQIKSPIYDVNINTSFSLYPFEPKTINENVISKIINTTKIQNKINNNTSSFVYDSVVNLVKTNSDLHLKNMTVNLSNFSNDPKFDFIHIKDNSSDINKTKLLFGKNYTDPMISGLDVNSIKPTYRPSNDNILIDGIGFEINTTKEQINNNNTNVLIFNGGDDKPLTSLVINDTKNTYIKSIPNKANVSTTNNTNLLDSILIHNNANLVPLSPSSSYIIFSNNISNEVDRSKVQNNKNNYSDTLIFAAEINTIFPTYNPNYYNKQINGGINEIKSTKEQIKIFENLKNNDFEVNLLPLMPAHENENTHFDGISNEIIVANGQNIPNTYTQSLLPVAHDNTDPATSTSYLEHGQLNTSSIAQENNYTKSQIKTNPNDSLLSNADVNKKPPISALKTEDGFNTTGIQRNVNFTDPLLSEGKINRIPSKSKLKYDDISINATSQKGNSTKDESKASSNDSSLANAGPYLIPVLKPNPFESKNISYTIKPTKVDINSIYNYLSLSEVPDYLVTTIYSNEYSNKNVNNISYDINRTRLDRDKHFTKSFLNVVENHTPIISSNTQPDKLHPNNIYNGLKNIVLTPDNIDFVRPVSPYFTNAEYLEPINLSFYNSTLIYPVSDLNVLNIRNPNRTLSFSHNTFDGNFANPLTSTLVNVNLSFKPRDDIKFLQKLGSKTESVNGRPTLSYSFDNTVAMDSVTNHVMFPFINVSDYKSTNILNNTYKISKYNNGQITSPSNILTSSFAVKDLNLNHKDFKGFSNTKGNKLFPLYTQTNAIGILNQPNISINAVIEKPNMMGDLVDNLSYRYNNTNSMNYVSTNNIFPNINLSDLHLTDTIFHNNNILNHNKRPIPTQREPFNSSFLIIDPNFHHKDFKDSSNTTGIETRPFNSTQDAIKPLNQPNISVSVIVEKPHVMSDLTDTLSYNYNNTNSILNYVTTNRIFPSINLSDLHSTNSIYNTNNISNYDIKKIPTPSNKSNSSFSVIEPNFHNNDFEVSSNTLVSMTNAIERLKIPNISVSLVVEEPHVGDLNDNFSFGYSNTIPMNYVTNNIVTALNISNSPLNDTIYNTNIIFNYEIGPNPTKSTPLDSSFSVIDPSFHLKNFEVSSNIKGIELFTFDTKTDIIEILNQTNISVNVVDKKTNLIGDLTDSSTFSYSNTNTMNDFTTKRIFPVINIQTHPLIDTIYHINSISNYDIGRIPTQSSPLNSSFSVIDPNFHHKDFKVSSNTKGIEILTLVNMTYVSERLKKPNISVNVVVEKPPVGDLTDNLSYNYSNMIPTNYVTTNNIFTALSTLNYPLTNTIYNTNSISNYDIGQISTQTTPFDSSFSIIDPNFHHQDFEVSSTTKGIEIFTLVSTADAIETLKKPNTSVNVVVGKSHVGDLTHNLSYNYNYIIPMKYVTTNHTFKAINISDDPLSDTIYNNNISNYDTGKIPSQIIPFNSSFSVLDPNFHHKDFEVSSNTKGFEIFTLDDTTDVIGSLKKPNISFNVVIKKTHVDDLTDNFSYSYNDTIPMNYVTTNHTFTALNIGLIPTQSTPLDSSFSVIDPSLHLKDFEVSSNIKGIELFTFDTKTDAIKILYQPNINVNVVVGNPHLLGDLNNSTYIHNNTNSMNDVTTNNIFPLINILTNPLNDTIYNVNSIYNYDIGRIPTQSNPFDNSFPIIDPNFKKFENTSNNIGIYLPTIETKTDSIDILNQPNIIVNAIVEKPHVVEDFDVKLSYSSNYIDPKHNSTANGIFPTINILDNHLTDTIQYHNSIPNYDVGQIHSPSNTFNSSFLNTHLNFHHKDFEVSSNTRGIEIFTLVSTTNAIERLNQSNISVNLVVEKPHVGDLTDNLFYSYNNTIPMNYFTTNHTFTALNISNSPLNDTIYNTNIISNYEIGPIPKKSTPLDSSFSVIDPSFHLKDFEVSSNIKGIELFTFDTRTDAIEILNQPNISVNVVVGKPHLVGDLTDNSTFGYSDTNFMNDVTTNSIFPVINIQTYHLTDTIHHPNSIPKYDFGHIPTLSTTFDSSFPNIHQNFHHKDFEVSSNTKGIDLFPLVNTTDAIERLKQLNMSAQIFVEKPHIVGNLTDTLSYIANYTVSKNYVTTNRIFPAINIPVHPLYDTIYNTNNISNYDIEQIPTQINPLNSSFSVIDPNFHHKDFEVSSNISGIDLFTFLSTTEKLKIPFDNINYKDKKDPSILIYNYVNTFVTEPSIIENQIPENNYTLFEINKSYSQIFPDHIQNSYNISTPIYIKESLINETRLHYNGSIYVDEGNLTKNIISSEAINIISDHNVSPLPVLNIITSISNTTNFVKHNTDIPKPLINDSYFDSHTYSGSYITTQTNNQNDLPFYADNQTKFVLNSSDLEHNLKIKMALPFIASNSEKNNTQINDVVNKHNMSKANFQSLNKSGKFIKLSGFDNNNLQLSNVSDNLNLQIYGYFHEINKTQSSKNLNYNITTTSHHQPNISEKSMKVLNYLGNYITNHAENNKLSDSLSKSGPTLKQGFNSHMGKEFHENYKSNENSKYFHNSISKLKASSLITNFSSILFQNNHTKPSIFTLLNMNHLNYSHHHMNHVNYDHQNINQINYDHDGINHESYAHQDMSHDGINHDRYSQHNINHINYAHQNINHINSAHQNINHINSAHQNINHINSAQQNINHINSAQQNINHINSAQQNMNNINYDHDVMNHESYPQHNMNQTNYAYQNIQNLKNLGMVDKVITNNTLFKTMLQESSHGSKSNLLNSLKSSSNNILNQGSEGNMNIWSNVNTHPNASHNGSPVSIIVIDKGIHVHNTDSNNNKHSSNKNNIFSKELEYQSNKRHKKTKIQNKKRKFMIPLPKIKKKHKKRKMKFFKLG